MNKKKILQKQKSKNPLKNGTSHILPVQGCSPHTLVTNNQGIFDSRLIEAMVSQRTTVIQLGHSSRALIKSVEEAIDRLDVDAFLINESDYTVIGLQLEGYAQRTNFLHREAQTAAIHAISGNHQSNATPGHQK